MVQTWGWEDFNRFYTQIKPPQPSGEASQGQPGTQSQVIDAALQEHLGITLPELEAGFLQALDQAPISAEMVQDVRLSVAFYDTMRRYQLALDPSAHFLAAWLPDVSQMRKDGLVADFLRHPAALENVALEAMLVEADSALRSETPGYPQAERLLRAVNAALDDLAAGKTAFPSDTLAADYLSIAGAVEQAGYQAQRISLDENTARVLAGPPKCSSNSCSELVELILYRSDSGWSFNFYGQVNPKNSVGILNGGVQYRFRLSNTKAAPTHTHSITTRQPSPAHSQVREIRGCSSS